MGQTLIGLLQESVVKYASLAALKTRKPDGSFQTLTYAELYTLVKELGTGLISIGLLPGAHVALLAENDQSWLVTDLAILGCGGVDVPLSPRTTDREIEYVIAHSDSEIAIAGDAAALMRLLAMRKSLSKLKKIVVMEFSGTKPHAGMGEERVLIYTWEDVLKKGNRKIAKGERQFDLRAASVAPTDTATLLYTSGTTGKPRGVMLSHGNIMHNVTNVHASISPPLGATWLSVLPVWHSFERTVEYCSLSFGGIIAYCEPSEWKIFDDLQALRPHYLVMVPSILENIARSLEKRLGMVQGLFIRFEKFYLVFSGFVMGRFPRFRRQERLLEVFAAFLPLVMLSPVKLASIFILRRKVQWLLGGNLRAIVSGGGALPAHLDRFFAAIGVDVLEGYGLTEASPIVAVRMEKYPVLGTVGRPLPLTEVRIVGENGDVLPPGRKGSVKVKGPQIMKGYYKDPVATRQILSADGWLDTGDTGILTYDGNLVITGRTKHTIVLGSGERFEPEPIEMVVQESPYVQQVVVVGDKRDSAGLLIVPNMDTLRRLAEARRIPWTNEQELTSDPAIYRFFQEEVQTRLANSGIHFPGGKSARIALIPSRFEVGRELTRNLSKRRDVIVELYGPVIEQLYRS
ncbi:MAG TPA: AMP-binding protein [Spirochaetia bacterium]|nr:AMP-binding protein [Spirochaetia bacterium]